MRDIFQRAIYRYGWDTRCRNRVPARILRTLLKDLPPQNAPVLLDVGCGRIGVAAFLDGQNIVGVDVEPPLESLPNFSFQQGTITALPFPDKAFPLVSCIDVVEHLPLEARARAIDELVRVAAGAVLIACPHSENARACDAKFQRELEARNKPVPDWLFEHQRQSYPTTTGVIETLRQSVAASGRKATISLSYCEPVRTCLFLRGAAARSDGLYVALNLALGLLLPLIPTPKLEQSYRMVILAEFLNDEAGEILLGH